MPTIYISDSGDDKNDGLSPQTPIYSLKRATKVHVAGKVTAELRRFKRITLTTIAA